MKDLPYDEWLARWKEQSEEWNTISRELLLEGRELLSAADVSNEQIKRALAEGRTLVTISGERLVEVTPEEMAIQGEEARKGFVP